MTPENLNNRFDNQDRGFAYSNAGVRKLWLDLERIVAVYCQQNHIDLGVLIDAQIHTIKSGEYSLQFFRPDFHKKKLEYKVLVNKKVIVEISPVSPKLQPQYTYAQEQFWVELSTDTLLLVHFPEMETISAEEIDEIIASLMGELWTSLPDGTEENSIITEHFSRESAFPFSSYKFLFWLVQWLVRLSNKLS